MTISENLFYMFDAMEKLEDQIETLREEAAEIMDLLFDSQRRIATNVSREPEFDSLRGAFYTPLRLFDSPAQHIGYSKSVDGQFASRHEWNPGDAADNINLLPIFMTEASDEEKHEAIREVFRSFIDEERNNAARSKEIAIESAYQILRENGISV